MCGATAGGYQSVSTAAASAPRRERTVGEATVQAACCYRGFPPFKVVTFPLAFLTFTNLNNQLFSRHNTWVSPAIPTARKADLLSNSPHLIPTHGLTAVRSVLPPPLSGLLGGNRRLLRDRASDRAGHGRACTGLDDDWIVMIQHYQTAAL